MGLAVWHEICIDVHDPRAGMAAFYAEAIGGTATTPRADADPGDVEGPVGGTLALCPVPEPVTVKNRVHLDVHVADVARLIAAGARAFREPDDEQHWTVLLDPEGNQLCAFVRDEPPAYRLYEVGVDAVDAETIARWWAERFGVEARNDGRPWWWLEGIPGAAFEALVFAPVPEPKTVKNRLHWDVFGEVDDFEGAGARVLWTMPRWTVMADPEGNEFCVFPERTG